MPETLVFSCAKILFLVSLATFCSSERSIPTHFLKQARAWFLKITSVRMYVCVCVCVSAPEAMNN